MKMAGTRRAILRTSAATISIAFMSSGALAQDGGTASAGTSPMSTAPKAATRDAAATRQVAAGDGTSAQQSYGNMGDDIVVTGTSIREKVLQTSFAVTTIGQETLARSPSLGLAALLTQVPGLWGEANGGEVNINVSPRGLRGGFLEYISLQEDGLPVLYDGFLEEYEVRRDLSYGRVEIIRGGPSGVLTSNGAASIVNFLSRNGRDNPGGEAQLSYSDYHSVRGDAYYGGEIGSGHNLFYSIGGYYRRGDGIKDVGFLGDHGGQVRANLMRTFDSGSVTLSYKHIDDHTSFFTPQPVQLTADGRARPIPGFNATDDYLVGPEERLLFSKTPTGSREKFDLRDGQAGRTDQLTLALKKDFGSDFHIEDTVRLARVRQVSLDLRGQDNSTIQSATTFLSSDPRVAGLISAFAPQGATHAVLLRASNGSAIASPSTMNGNGLLAQQINNKFSQSSDQIINKFQVTYDHGINTATAGILTWDVDMNVRQTANTFLMDVTNNAHLIDVAAVNAAGQVVGHLTDRGVLQYGTSGTYGNGTVGIRSNSFFFNDQLRVTPRFHLDAGIRYERVKYTSSAEDQSSNAPLAGAFTSTGADMNNILADNFGGSFGTGTFTYGKRRLHDVAWTVGGNYEVTRHLAVYARYSDAFDTGIPNFGPFCAGLPEACLPAATTKLRFAEFGVRYSTPTLYATATAFRSTNKNVAVLVGSGGDSVPVDNQATGVEFEARWQPVSLLSMELSGVIQNSEIKSVRGSSVFDGNQLDRLPNVQVRFTPTVHFLNDRGQLYGTVAYYGKRFGDLANTLRFDAYAQFDAGVSYRAFDNLTISVQATNITDKFALTAGNPRGNSIVAGSNAYGFAHAILPRVVKLSIDAHF